MRVVRIDVRRLRIPLRFSFKHALAERSVGDSLLVRALDDQGRVGWGEGAPRPYVTGEHPRAAMELLEAVLAPEFAGSSFDSLDELAAALRDRGQRLERDQNAAFCALELALLDLGGRAFGRSAGELVGDLVRSSVRYSGIVSAGTSDEVTETCGLLRKAGVSAVKVKVGGDLDDDLRALSIVREQLGDDVSLRIDANCAWDVATAVHRLRTFEAFRLDGVEQPCPADDIEANARVTAESGANTIADESLASLHDAERLAERGAFRMFNVRISKCGGLLLSARVRDLALEAGVGLMVGAQVGETALLSAAGRHLALRTPGLRFAEGSYGALLLERDLSDTAALGPGAEGGELPGPGLGLEPHGDRMTPYLDRPWPAARAGTR